MVKKKEGECIEQQSAVQHEYTTHVTYCKLRICNQSRVRIDKLPFAPVRRRPEPGDYRRAYVLVIT